MEVETITDDERDRAPVCATRVSGGSGPASSISRSGSRGRIAWPPGQSPQSGSPSARTRSRINHESVPGSHLSMGKARSHGFPPDSSALDDAPRETGRAGLRAGEAGASREELSLLSSSWHAPPSPGVNRLRQRNRHGVGAPGRNESDRFSAERLDSTGLPSVLVVPVPQSPVASPAPAVDLDRRVRGSRAFFSPISTRRIVGRVRRAPVWTSYQAPRARASGCDPLSNSSRLLPMLQSYRGYPGPSRLPIFEHPVRRIRQGRAPNQLPVMYPPLLIPPPFLPPPL